MALRVRTHRRGFNVAGAMIAGNMHADARQIECRGPGSRIGDRRPVITLPHAGNIQSYDGGALARGRGMIKPGDRAVAGASGDDQQEQGNNQALLQTASPASSVAIGVDCAIA